MKKPKIRKPGKERCVVAHDLGSAKYRPRIVKSKKLYSRKKPVDLG